MSIIESWVAPPKIPAKDSMRNIISSDISRLKTGIAYAITTLDDMEDDKSQELDGCLTDLLDGVDLNYEGMMSKIVYPGRLSLDVDDYLAVFLTHLKHSDGEYGPLAEFLDGAEGDWKMRCTVTKCNLTFHVFYCALGLKVMDKAEELGFVKTGGRHPWVLYSTET